MNLSLQEYSFTHYEEFVGLLNQLLSQYVYHFF